MNHASFYDAIKSQDRRWITADGIKKSEESDDEWKVQKEPVLLYLKIVDLME
jgi:hypothetical protein